MARTMEKAKIAIRLAVFSVLVAFNTVLLAAQPEFLAATNETFAHPHDLEFSPNGKWIFVADVNHHDIKLLDADTLEQVAIIGKGQLDSPHDVHFDSAGRLLVADSGNNRIAIFELDGTKARLVDELTDNLRSPEGVTSDVKGHVYVASTGNHRVLKFRGKRIIKQVGERGGGKLEFVRPHDIEMGSDGWLYVSDPGNKRIQILADDLSYRGVIEDNRKPFDEPKYLALDDNNWLYIADQHNNALRVFDARHQEVLQIKNAGAKPLNYIEGVEVAADRIWISDTYNNRIVLFRWSP